MCGEARSARTRARMRHGLPWRRNPHGVEAAEGEKRPAVRRENPGRHPVPVQGHRSRRQVQIPRRALDGRENRGGPAAQCRGGAAALGALASGA
jgi:hypothetical protein